MIWLKYIAIAALAVLAPIHSMIIVVGILIFTDTLTGIMAAYKRGEKITSSEMRRSISKLFIYQTVLIGSFLIETFLIGGILPVSKLVAGTIGMVEVKSLLENAETILGQPIFKSIISKLGSKNEPK